jgi:FkbM family methyltransferase
MYLKFFKKIIGIFGFKLVSKNLIKIEREIENNNSLSLDQILTDIFEKKNITGLIQVGANDGLRFDNINKFIKKHKTKSVLVEPIKEYFDRLKENYKDCENIFFENTAISVNNQINYLYKVKTDNLYKYDDHIKGISSYDFNHLIKHGVKKKHITKEKIESISITKLFEKYDFNIDLLFIDAEGYDAEIAIDLLQKSNFRPIIIIEYVHIKLPSIKVLNNLFIEKKYKYFKIRENLICIPNERSVIINI